jgi:hypothetical protein
MAKSKPKDILGKLSPAKFAAEVKRGFDRLEPDRYRSRFTCKLMAGPAFTSDKEIKLDSPLALLFNVGRTLLPQLVIPSLRHVIETPYLPARQYAQSLGLALSLYDKKQRMPSILRCVIMDALHNIGIMKTGLEAGGDVLSLENEEEGNTKIDVGEIYTERISFDDFVADPDSREYLYLDARFIGNKIRVPRRVLLDSGKYKKDIVERLPRNNSNTVNEKKTANLTMGNINIGENADLEDIVEICELWVPSANSIVTIPGDFDYEAKDYLRVAPYFGVKEGPYTFLSLTIPVPDQPLPVPLMRVLFQLEMAVNRMAVKISMQADRQKDILAYKASEVENAKKVVDASDGEAISMDDPSAINKISLGGQENSNVEHLNMLMSEFNMLASNVETLSGVSSAAKSATAANLLDKNASICLSDMQNAVYDASAQEARKRTYLIHTNPMLNELLSKRVMNAGQMQIGPTGVPQWVTPPTIEEVQFNLTPEDRSGDFLDLVFKVEPESEGRMDSKTRLQQEQMFCQQILPAVAGAAQICQTLGIPFDASQMLWHMAQDMGITWLDSVLFAPAIQQKAAMEYNAIQMATGGDVRADQKPPMMNNAIAQNGQPGNVMAPQPTPPQQANMAAQGGAVDAQRVIRSALLHGIGGKPPAPALPTANAF